MLTKQLRQQFESVLEINNLDLSIVDKIASKDANILRPVKGVAFEVYFRKILSTAIPCLNISAGVGDSDIDLIVNGKTLQLKTIDAGSTVQNQFVGVALHKTHGNEKRPHNLYSKSNKTFDFLVVLHPQSGVMIIPYSEIPINSTYPNHLADPAKFIWVNNWINRWDLLGFDNFKNKCLDTRIPPKASQLPFLSKVTFLEDYEIVEMMCRPEYFRAAVMGLKGNIKQHWFIDYLDKNGYKPSEPREPYCKYDVYISDKNKSKIRIQIKGTSKNMCAVTTGTIGVEVMGTHGQFPHRGYKKTMFDYVAIIISEFQLPSAYKDTGLHFLLIPMADLPLHYMIGNGASKNKPNWDLPEYADVIYPNIKLKHSFDSNKKLNFQPNLTSYSRSNGFDTIPLNSAFRKAGPFTLDEINIQNL